MDLNVYWDILKMTTAASVFDVGYGAIEWLRYMRDEHVFMFSFMMFSLFCCTALLLLSILTRCCSSGESLYPSRSQIVLFVPSLRRRVTFRQHVIVPNQPLDVDDPVRVGRVVGKTTAISYGLYPIRQLTARYSSAIYEIVYMSAHVLEMEQRLIALFSELRIDEATLIKTIEYLCGKDTILTDGNCIADATHETKQNVVLIARKLGIPRLLSLWSDVTYERCAILLDDWLVCQSEIAAKKVVNDMKYHRLFGLPDPAFALFQNQAGRTVHIYESKNAFEMDVRQLSRDPDLAGRDSYYGTIRLASKTDNDGRMHDFGNIGEVKGEFGNVGVVKSDFGNVGVVKSNTPKHENIECKQDQKHIETNGEMAFLTTRIPGNDAPSSLFMVGSCVLDPLRFETQLMVPKASIEQTLCWLKKQLDSAHLSWHMYSYPHDGSQISHVFMLSYPRRSIRVVTIELSDQGATDLVSQLSESVIDMEAVAYNISSGQIIALDRTRRALASKSMLVRLWLPTRLGNLQTNVYSNLSRHLLGGYRLLVPGLVVQKVRTSPVPHPSYRMSQHSLDLLDLIYMSECSGMVAQIRHQQRPFGSNIDDGIINIWNTYPVLTNPGGFYSRAYACCSE